MTAIALICGFALGAGCSAALLAGLRAAPGFLGGKAEHSEFDSEAVNRGEAPGLPIDRQWQNLWNYNGTSQKTEGVSNDGHQD
jgi:hypothetical protein